MIVLVYVVGGLAILAQVGAYGSLFTKIVAFGLLLVSLASLPEAPSTPN